MENSQVNEIYDRYNNINPYKGIGLGENSIRRIKDKNPNKKSYTTYYFVPKWISKYDKDKWISSSKIKNSLEESVSFQIYYDIVYLGISCVEERPKCKYCNRESNFNQVKKYTGYCLDHKYKHIGDINRLHFKGKPLSEETKKKLSAAKKGKKLTEEQRLRRPRGYHFNHSEETKEKISRSKKGKTRSRSYYKSGIYYSKKCNEVINYLSSYERDFLILCDYSRMITSIEIPDPIEYYFNGGNHNYYPDFLIKTDSGISILVEIKAYNLLNDEKILAKKIAAKKWARKRNIKYIILTEKDLYKKQKIRGERILNRSFRIYDYL